MSGTGGDHDRTVRRLVGVYNANGTLSGELAYFVRARLGRAHCALCDVTHGLVKERPEWKTCRASLPVPFDTFHLNDQPAAVRAGYDGVAPVVLGETDDGYVVLLDARELETCAGSVDELARAVDKALEAAGLIWPS